jgi:RNA polymerase sigma-70 factor (ECF subfamily)
VSGVLLANMADHADNELVERLRRRDEGALVELASLYGARIFQLALRYVKNREDAEEVVQDVLLKVHRKIEAFRGDSALSSWIYRITFNTAMSRLRHTRAARFAEVPDAPASATGLDDLPSRAHEPADWSNLADESMLRRQMLDRLFEAVDDLPEIYREPVILRDLEGLTTEEASSRLRLKDQTLKSRLHRGRLLLRERLSDFAGGLSMHRPVEAY